MSIYNHRDIDVSKYFTPPPPPLNVTRNLLFCSNEMQQ